MVCGGQVEHRQFDLPNYEQRPSRRGKGGIASFGSLACMKQYYFWPTPEILFLKKTMTMPTGRRRFGQDFLPQLLTGGIVSTQGPGQTGLPLREVRQLVDPVGFDDKGFSTKLLEHRSRLSTMEERSTLLRSVARRYRRSGCTYHAHAGSSVEVQPELRKQ